VTLDLNQFKAPAIGKQINAKPKRLPRHKRGEWFIKGPIPGDWVGRAAALPGKALHVALAVWLAASLGRGRVAKLTGKGLARFGVRPDAGRRALATLQTAGLVKVDRGAGRCPVVTIIEPTDEILD
jgi:hypothetical protein